MAQEFQCWTIDARLSDIALGRIQANGSLWLQYGIEQLCRPTGAAAEVYSQLRCKRWVRIVREFKQFARLRLVCRGEAPQTAARLLMVPKSVRHD